MRAYFRILSRFALSLMVVIPLGMLLFPGALRATRAQDDPCQSNLKEIALGIFQYVQDYDEKYPIAKVNSTGIKASNPWGWADALTPYLKPSSSRYHCPSNPQYKNKRRPSNPQSWGYTDYFYNSHLSGANQADVEQVALTVLLGDGNDGTGGTSARYSLGGLPHEWRQNKNSPSFRHQGAAYYAFTDGHVALLKPNLITGHPAHDGYLTFAVK